MKRELASAALLVLLIVGSAWNIHAINSLTEDICASLDASQAAMSHGDRKLAEDELERGLKMWLEADSYTHIFIRHSEIDSTTDAFYEALETLAGDDPGALSPSYAKLRYHLDSINGMEHISIGSIL